MNPATLHARVQQLRCSRVHFRTGALVHILSVRPCLRSGQPAHALWHGYLALNARHNARHVSRILSAPEYQPS